MRRQITSTLAVTALVAVPAVSQAATSTAIGTGKQTCILKAGADCRGVVHRWTAEHHGNLRRINLRTADLRGADFRGVDLRNADLRGAKFRHADFRGARLTGARFGQPPEAAKASNGLQTKPCRKNCGTDMAGANLAGADLTGADLSLQNLHGANLTSANLTGTNLSGANLVGANLANVTWSNTVCPSGVPTWIGC